MLFASFAAISFTNALAGKASCGCAGSQQVSPWYSLALSLAMLTALALTRPALGEVRSLLTSGLWRALSPATLLVAAPAILVVTAYYANPAPFDRQFARLRGETVMVRPFALDYGELPPGGSATMALEVVNLSNEPVELLGGRSDCGCTVTQDLPQTIPPGSTATVRVRIDVKPNAEPINYRSSVDILSTRGTIVSGARWRVAPAE